MMPFKGAEIVGIVTYSGTGSPACRNPYNKNNRKNIIDQHVNGGVKKKLWEELGPIIGTGDGARKTSINILMTKRNVIVIDFSASENSTSVGSLSRQLNVPEKIPAEGTEGGLTEELGHEFVTFNLVDFVVLDGTAPPRDPTAAQTEIVTVQCLALYFTGQTIGQYTMPLKM